MSIQNSSKYKKCAWGCKLVKEKVWAFLWYGRKFMDDVSWLSRGSNVLKMFGKIYRWINFETFQDLGGLKRLLILQKVTLKTLKKFENGKSLKTSNVGRFLNCSSLCNQSFLNQKLLWILKLFILPSLLSYPSYEVRNIYKSFYPLKNDFFLCFPHNLMQKNSLKRLKTLQNSDLFLISECLVWSL